MTPEVQDATPADYVVEDAAGQLERIRFHSVETAPIRGALRVELMRQVPYDSVQGQARELAGHGHFHGIELQTCTERNRSTGQAVAGLRRLFAHQPVKLTLGITDRGNWSAESILQPVLTLLDRKSVV